MGHRQINQGSAAVSFIYLGIPAGILLFLFGK